MESINHKNSLLYQILGILCYMKSHKEDLDVGVWSIARPNILRTMKEVLSPEILEKLSACDELSALYKLGGEEEVTIKIQECMDLIMQEISISEDKNIEFIALDKRKEIKY